MKAGSHNRSGKELNTLATRWRALAEGRERDRVFTEILEKLAPYISLQVSRASARGLEADDAHQLARVAVFEALCVWEPTRASFWTFVFGRIWQSLRTRWAVPKLGEVPEEIADQRPTVSLDDMILLQQALTCLTDNQRCALVIRFFEGATVREAAEQMGITPNRVRVLIREALQQIRAGEFSKS